MKAKYIRILGLSLIFSLMIGCGKEKVAENSGLNIAPTEDIYATQGATEEKKVEEVVEEEPTVDEKALLKDALKDITSVRMITNVNVDGLPTSKETTVSTNDIVELTTSENEISEDIKEEVITDKEAEEKVETEVKEETKKDSKVDSKTNTEENTQLDSHHSALDVTNKTANNSKTPKKEDKSSAKKEEDLVVETKDTEEGTTVESEEENTTVFVPTDESSYYINMKITTDIDTARAKNYGRLRMNLGAIVDKEEATYVDYSLEPASSYTIKHSIELGADDEGNSAEVVASKWYRSESDFYGLATLREILENSNIVSYNETTENHIIGVTVDKNIAEKLDLTQDVMKVLFEGKDTVNMTYYLSKADGILTRIVITMTDFKDTVLSKVDVQNNNYIITFEKYNDINKVLIPDTILSSALEITGEENFISDKELVKYNFEQMAIEQSVQDDSSVEEDKDTEESLGTEKDGKEETVEDKKESSGEKQSADEALKSTKKK